MKKTVIICDLCGDEVDDEFVVKLASKPMGKRDWKSLGIDACDACIRMMLSGPTTRRV